MKVGIGRREAISWFDFALYLHRVVVAVFATTHGS